MLEETLKVPNNVFECIILLLSLNVILEKMDQVISVILMRDIKRISLVGISVRSMQKV